MRHMLPVCSATPSYSSPSQIPLCGGFQPLCSFRKDLESRYIVEVAHLGSQYGTHSLRNSFITQATKSVYSCIAGGTEQLGSLEFPRNFSSVSEPEYFRCSFTDPWNFPLETTNGLLNSGELTYAESYNLSAVSEGLTDFTEPSTGGLSTFIPPEEPETLLGTDMTSDKFAPIPDSIELDSESLSSSKESIGDLFTGINKSISASVAQGENAFQSSLDTTNSFIRSFIENATKSAEKVFGEALSTVDQTGQLANKKLTSFSSELSGATSKVPAVAIDLLRRTIITVESSLTNGASYIVYLYGSAKELLPVGIRDTVNVYEGKATEILRPIGSASQEIYMAIYSLEKILGLDPNDPIVPFVIVVGSSVTLWSIYRLWTYGGYSGDLPPKSTLELLAGNTNAVLIDVRNEDLREKDGIPVLRRGARFRYANVSQVEIDESIKKMLKGGRDVEDSLIAVIIRNLKIVKDSSKVIVMDADGTRSKGIARSLRKIGIKNPYLVQGGFQSWVKQGLRIKELKPETTLAILNEEAEAILEDISPSPLQVVGYGVALIVGLYALLEWEKTLQLIGVFGLSLTIYLRVASYENAEDLKQDVRLLLSPVRLGAEAFSWAAGKLESNGLRLPTSPSSLDVQNRVLQAAAKHESQPSDSEDIQGPLPESTVPLNENV